MGLDKRKGEDTTFFLLKQMTSMKTQDKEWGQKCKYEGAPQPDLLGVGQGSAAQQQKETEWAAVAGTRREDEREQGSWS